MSDSFSIITDDFADLPAEYIAQHRLVVLPTQFSVNDVDYTNDQTQENYLSPAEFYAKLRHPDAQTKTSALSMDVIHRAMEAELLEGRDVIYLAFSSGLSGTANNGRLAKEELESIYPERKIFVVDSLCASMGEGLFVHYAVGLRDAGKSVEETAAQMERDKLKFCHYFTVDDLHFLQRGGRVSKTTAVIGSMLGIKPILHVNDEGKLIAIGKVRGRKQSLEALVTRMEEKIGDNKNDIIFISHGDCKEDAEYVASLVKKKLGIKSFLINYVGTTIGAHSGPGTIALFFIGNSR